ncbi:MAG TPA: HAD-IIA family hydrolase [Pirellulaceae bacterium]|nr:HAD-IIA family hydrolase [Pirellulaceae bacterium]
MNDELPDLRAYDAVLLDLDGTIFHEEVALPGAMELVADLQRRRQPFAFVSNSELSPNRLRERLRAMGADVPPELLYTAAVAGCDYVRAHFGPGVRAYSVAAEATDELLAGYATWVDDDRADCDVVLTGSLAQENATPERLQIAFRQIVRGATHLAFNADRAYPTARGFEIGAGALAAMLVYAANHQPIYCGKPQQVFFESLCQRIGVPAERCVLIGDNLESDVRGARRVGMASILTLTGLTTRAHLSDLALDLTPHYVVDDLRQLLT